MDISIDWISEEYYKHRPFPKEIRDSPDYPDFFKDKMFLNKFQPDVFFIDINSLVLMLTPACNFSIQGYCKHCATNYNNFNNGKDMPVLYEDLVFDISTLISPASQYTLSGGEIFLLDRQLRETAIEKGLLDKRFSDFPDYLPKLVSVLAEKLHRDWEDIDKSRPALRAYGEDRFIRMPTNGFLLPWIENINLKDESEVRKSDLYKHIYENYRHATIQLSVSPFHEMQYLKASEKSGNKYTLSRRIDELVSVMTLLNKDYPSEKDGLKNYSLGFVYNYCIPRVSCDIDEDEWNHLDRTLGFYDRGITNNPEKNLNLKNISGVFPIEYEVVKKEGKGKMLPGTLRIDNARLPNIAETDELYVVPGDQGKKARVYPDVLSYYQNNMKNTLMEVSLP